MHKYLKTFEKNSDYDSYTTSDEMVKPHVALVKENKSVFFKPKKIKKVNYIYSLVVNGMTRLYSKYPVTTQLYINVPMGIMTLNVNSSNTRVGPEEDGEIQGLGFSGADAIGGKQQCEDENYIYQIASMFTVDTGYNSYYYFEPGMTWTEWTESVYNTNGFFCSGGEAGMCVYTTQDYKYYIVHPINGDTLVTASAYTSKRVNWPVSK